MEHKQLFARYAPLLCPAAGLGCAVALYGMLVWAPAAFNPAASAPLPNIGVHAGSLANGLALLLLALLASHVSRLLPRLAAILVAAGSALWCAPNLLGSPDLLTAAAGVVSGLGVACAFVYWLQVLAAQNQRATHAALVGAALVSAGLNAITGFLPQGGLGVFALVCAVGQIVLILARRPLDSVASPDMQSVREAASALTPVLVSSIVLTFVAPLVNTVLMVDVLDPAVRLGLSASMNALVGVGLAAVWFIPQRPPSLFLILLVFTGVLFAFILLVWVIGFQAASVLLGLGSAAFFLVTFLVMDASLEAARSYGLLAVQTYGVAGGLVMLARTGADVVAASLLHAGIADESKTLAAVFLLVYLLTCAAFLLVGAIKRSGTPQPAMAASAEPTVWERLAQQCEHVSGAFGLSQREREVLALIMQGRNVPAIAEELVLSRNTVQTHVRHIYENLGVHSRKELVAFVEGFDETQSPMPLG